MDFSTQQKAPTPEQGHKPGDDVSYVPLSAEERREYDALLQTAWAQADNYSVRGGSRTSYHSLMAAFSAVENFVRARAPAGWTNNYAAAAERKYFAELEHNEDQSVQLTRLKLAGANVSEIRHVLIPPNEIKTGVIPGQRRGYKVKTQDRLAWLMEGLQKMNPPIFADDLEVTAGEVRKNMMRESSYLTITIPRINKQILLCEQVGEATFVNTRGIENPAFYLSHTKEQLKAIPGIYAMTLLNRDKWLRGLEILLKKNPPENTDKIDISNYVAPERITLTATMRENLIALMEQKNAGARLIIKAIPEELRNGLNAPIINGWVGRKNGDKWPDSTVRADYWHAVWATLYNFPDTPSKRIEFTAAMHESLLAKMETKDMGAISLWNTIHKRKQKDVTPNKINRWIAKKDNGEWLVGTVREDLWRVVNRVLNKAPDALPKTIVPITEDMRKDLIAKMTLKDMKARAVFKAIPVDKRNGLDHHSIIYSWYCKKENGARGTESVRLDHWELVHATLDAAPDVTPVKVIHLTESMRAEFMAKMAQREMNSKAISDAIPADERAGVDDKAIYNWIYKKKNGKWHTTRVPESQWKSANNALDAGTGSEPEPGP